MGRFLSQTPKSWFFRLGMVSTHVNFAWLPKERYRWCRVAYSVMFPTATSQQSSPQCEVSGSCPDGPTQCLLKLLFLLPSLQGPSLWVSIWWATPMGNLALSNPAVQPAEPRGGSVLILQRDLITSCKILLPNKILPLKWFETFFMRSFNPGN